MGNKKKVNSKKKGNSFERDVAKKLTEIFSSYTEDKFVRCPTSGALLGGRNSTINKNTSTEFKRVFCGDLVVPENFKYFIECKSYKNIDLYSLLYSTKHIIYSWIDECISTNSSEYESFLLIMKMNNKQWLILCDEQMSKLNNMQTYLHLQYCDKKYYIYNFDDFFVNFEIDLNEIFFSKKLYK